jgi:RES domain-containing protein
VHNVIVHRGSPSHAHFDHQEGTGDTEERGVYYAGLTLDCAVVEAFDIGVVEPGTKHLARVYPTREMTLLDLRARAALRAGTVAGIASADHALAQQWARYIYDNPAVYGEVDGILYASAHNGDDAVALFERVNGALACPAGHDAPLTDLAVLTAIRRSALTHELVVLPP